MYTRNKNNEHKQYILKTSKGDQLCIPIVEIPKGATVLGEITREESKSAYDIPFCSIQGRNLKYVKNKKALKRKNGLMTDTGEYVAIHKKEFRTTRFDTCNNMHSFYCKSLIPDIPEQIEEVKEIIIDNNSIKVEEEPVKENSQGGSEMAYISGQSQSYVSEEQPYVYLQNSDANDKYYLSYEVYVKDKLVHETKLIAHGYSSPWDAFDCKNITDGENSISYLIHIYDLDGEEVANTTVNGLTVIKLN